MDERARLQATVRGSVQGVGFRRWAEREARLLGLSGWVRNLDDGHGVEVVAEGPRPALDALLASLHQGPRHAYVEEVQFTLSPETGTLHDFRIRS